MKYQVDADAIVAGSAATARTVETIRSEVAALQSQLTSMQGSWVGAASLAFGDVLTNWTATSAQVNAALDQIQFALRAAADQYSQTEAANLALFRR